jgi:hypothetical protein
VNVAKGVDLGCAVGLTAGAAVGGGGLAATAGSRRSGALKSGVVPVGNAGELVRLGEGGVGDARRGSVTCDAWQM